MTLDISHVLETGYYSRVVAFAKSVGLYAPTKPWPSPTPVFEEDGTFREGEKYWYSRERAWEYRRVEVLDAPSPDGHVLLIDVPQSPGLSVRPFRLRVEDLHALYDPGSWLKRGGNQMHFLSRALEYLDGYAETKEEGRVFGSTRTELYPDRAPGSFAFRVYRPKTASDPYLRDWILMLDGGLIYHGPTDGWGAGADAPTLAVVLDAVQGWAIHT